jgi:hypothetical protein
MGLQRGFSFCALRVYNAWGDALKSSKLGVPWEVAVR